MTNLKASFKPLSSDLTREDGTTWIHMFTANIQTQLSEFTQWYLTASKDDPENFPSHMSEAEWFEQFMMFQSMDAGIKTAK